MKKLIYIGFILLSTACVPLKEYKSLQTSYLKSTNICDSILLQKDTVISNLRNDRAGLLRKMNDTIYFFTDKIEELIENFDSNLKKNSDTISSKKQLLENEVDYLRLENLELRSENARLRTENSTLLEKNESLNKKSLPEETINKEAFSPNYAEHISEFRIPFDAYIVDLSKNSLNFIWKDEHNRILKSISNVKSFYEIQSKELVFATNGGMYKKDNSPKGLYVEDSNVLSKIDLQKEGYGNFYMQPNGIFMIDYKGDAHIIKSSEYLNFKDKVKYATQSGPMLLSDNVINSNFNKNSPNRLIRSGVGIIDKNKVVFVISNEPVTFYEFALVFKNKYKCKNALYLDGVISQMYTPELNRFDSGGNFGVIITIQK